MFLILKWHTIPWSSCISLESAFSYPSSDRDVVQNVISVISVRDHEVRDIDPCNLPLYCTVQETVANPDNCTNYFECLFGDTWFERHCSPPLFFDYERKVCDLGQNCMDPCPLFTGPSTPEVTEGTPPVPSKLNIVSWHANCSIECKGIHSWGQ